MEYLSFNIGTLIGIVIFTYALFLFVSKKLHFKGKLFFLLVFTFILVYSGLGAALTDANPEYIPYYVIYLLCLALVLKFFNGGIKYTEQDKERIENSINKHHKKIIVCFILLDSVSLIYPEFKLLNLVHPPSPDLTTIDFTATGKGGDTMIGQIVYLVRTFLVPFFYLSLYKYRDNVGKLSLILIIDLYVGYCANAYVARNAMLLAILLVALPYYQKLTKRQRRKMAIGAAFIAPFLLYFFYSYSLQRLGRESAGIEVGMASQLLISQEIGYPLLYEYYFKPPFNLVSTYFIWILLLPLPGFLKFGFGNMPVGKYFSTTVLGKEPEELGFYVILPGLVGESIYIFGPYLFFIHAIILAVMMKFVYNTLKEHEAFTYIFYYFAIEFSFILSRAGTAAVYPQVAKSFLMLIIVLYFIKKKGKRNGKSIHVN